MKNIIFTILASALLLGCKNTEKQIDTPTPAKAPSRIENLKVLVSEQYQMNNTGDPYTIHNAMIQNGFLVLEISFGGGCAAHEFEMRFNNAFMETESGEDNLVRTSVRLSLFHNANNDRCRSIVKKTLHVDLSNIQTRSTNNIQIHLSGYESPLTYSYTNNK